ncbi:ABC transporter permease [Proteocatella sphenisci]|uniref:ABC transporter permease n=1 Tax=Proteocatella sphenisci TaxID=181070 RepID=UPI00048F3868|nr:ABC transporter permease [Proteocatella sphenisci]
MTKKLKSITNNIHSIAFIAVLVLIWHLVCRFELVPAFMLPSPESVVAAFFASAALMMDHAVVTLAEAFAGLFLSIIFALLLAIMMNESEFIKKTIYPSVIITQTVPAIALAPLLVLWMGYGMAPKIALIFITCFFPMVVSTLSGLMSVDEDIIRLFKSMGAGRLKILLWVKLPSAMESFFSGLRLAVSYSIVGAVIAEWLGGNRGLGVYMTRVRKSYAFDKMFAVIIFISIISLLLMKIVDIIQKKSMPWKNLGDKSE